MTIIVVMVISNQYPHTPATYVKLANVPQVSESLTDWPKSLPARLETLHYWYHIHWHRYMGQYCVVVISSSASIYTCRCIIEAWYCVPSDQKRVSPPTFLPPAITGERPIIIIIISILIVLTSTGWFPQPPAQIFGHICNLEFESWWSRAILFAVDRNFWDFLWIFWHISAG